MRILVSSLGPPLLAFGGGAMTSHTLLRSLLQRGHEVGVLYLEPDGHGSPERAAARGALRDLGVRSVESVPLPPPAPLPTRVRGKVLYTPRALRRWAQAADEVARHVEALRPQVCFLYGIEAIEAFGKVRDVPKVGGMGVFAHNLVRVRLGLRPSYRPRDILERVLNPVTERNHQRNSRELFETLDGLCFFADNYAQHCRKAWGLEHVTYLPNPALDERANRSPPTAPGRKGPHYRVTLVGHLLGTATQSGLKFFATQLLPELERRGEADLFEFLVIGRFRPQPWLERLLRRPNIRFLGFVDNFADTIHGADALLVPIPADVGNRVRIVSAFSAEACVVTHASSRLGMPELVHEENCLVGETPAELAEQLRRACTDAALNARLRRGGRACYEQWFEPSVVGARLEAYLEGFVARPEQPTAMSPSSRPPAPAKFATAASRGDPSS